jgi:hypothetical protein
MLLPYDPEGELYAMVLDALSANEKCARAFIKTTHRVHCIALLKRSLTEQECYPSSQLGLVAIVLAMAEVALCSQILKS